MAYGRTVLVLGTILASLTFILAEEGSGAGSDNAANERLSFSLPSFGINYNSGGLSGGGGFPNFFGGGGNDSSNPFGQFLSAFGQLFPGMNGNNSRQTRDIHSYNVEEDGPRSRQRRLANAIPINCNYTAEPGAKCGGCASRIICLKGDRGYLQGCTLKEPYCNGGKCSINPTAICFYNSTESDL